MARMIELHSLDEPFELKGRGWVYPVPAPRGVNPREWTAQEVMLDGHLVKVRGVETFAVSDYAITESDWPAGVLVTERLPT